MCGIQVVRVNEFSERFMFMVRVEEAGEAFPTILTAMTEHGWGHSLTWIGEIDIPHGELLHWKRYDILDQLSGRWGQTCPFRGWNQGDRLYELRTDNTTVLLSSVDLLGDWIPPDGSYAFFTSEEDARHYCAHHLSDGNNRMFSIITDSDTPSNPVSELRPEPVDDLKGRLAELYDNFPFPAWCINPISNREDSGYGRFTEDMPGSMLKSTTGYVPQMIAVSGHWSVQAGNIFKMEKSLAPWTKSDTVRWSGGQALHLAPLDRTFVNCPKNPDIENMTESDLEAWVETEVFQVGDEVYDQLVFGLIQYDDWDSAEGEGDDIHESNDRLDRFHIVYWDAVTGDGGIFIFSEVIDALKFLVVEERTEDRKYRVTGASSHSHIGFSGSNDEEFEQARGQRFGLGIRRIAKRIMKEGYHPRYADDIVALCNATLQTLHIECAGFPKDLIWQSDIGMVNDVCKLLKVNEDVYREWVASADPSINSEGKKLVLERMEVGAWKSLSKHSQSFLATAFYDLDKRGYASKLDYAPISMELAKALEKELGLVLGRFRHELGDNLPNYNDEDHEKSLVSFIKGGRAPTLGKMSHLLRKPGTNPSELCVALHDYLISHENHKFLTSSKFANKALNRVIHKYRNSGVHDSPISYETCMECMDDLIGTYEKPGYLQLLVASGGTQVRGCCL